VACTLLVGLAVMIAEITMGRKARANAMTTMERVSENRALQSVTAQSNPADHRSAGPDRLNRRPLQQHPGELQTLR